MGARRAIALASVPLVMLGGTGIAYADDVSNSLDASVDATAEVMSLTAGGAAGATNLYVTARQLDGVAGCNLKNVGTLVVSVSSSNPAVASVTPSSVTFSDCDELYPIAVNPLSAGTTTVSVSETSNNTGGTFNLAPATFTVNVAAAPAPTDSTPPMIGYTLDPASPDGANGWYTGDVTLTWSVTDAQSGITGTTGCVDQFIDADQQETPYSCSAVSAGGQADPVSVSIKRDATPPSIQAGAPSGTLGTNNWYTSAVSVGFTATDGTSGVATTPNPATASTGTGEGSAVELTSLPSFSDNAGNGASATFGDTFKVDLGDPAAPTIDGGPAGDTYFGYVPAKPTCTSSDAVSGLKDCVVTGYSTAVGPHTLTATATDNAGRTSTATQSYTVLPWRLSGFYAPVDVTPVGAPTLMYNTVKGGSTVPLKFEMFAGSTEITSTDAVSFAANKVACASGATEDSLEMVSSGNTSLRYDTTGGQFIQNWKTPTGAGACYKVTMTASDGGKLEAHFKLK